MFRSPNIPSKIRNFRRKKCSLGDQKMVELKKNSPIPNLKGVWYDTVGLWITTYMCKLSRGDSSHVGSRRQLPPPCEAFFYKYVSRNANCCHQSIFNDKLRHQCIFLQQSLEKKQTQFQGRHREKISYTGRIEFL